MATRWCEYWIRCTTRVVPASIFGVVGQEVANGTHGIEQMGKFVTTV